MLGMFLAFTGLVAIVSRIFQIVGSANKQQQGMSLHVTPKHQLTGISTAHRSNVGVVKRLVLVFSMDPIFTACRKKLVDTGDNPPSMGLLAEAMIIVLVTVLVLVLAVVDLKTYPALMIAYILLYTLRFR